MINSIDDGIIMSNMVVIELRLFVALVLQYSPEKILIPNKLAKQLAVLDANELYCHIEYVDNKQDGELYQLMWDKRLWDMSVEKLTKNRNISEANRQIAYKLERNIQRLTVAINKLTRNVLSEDQVTSLAYNIVRNKPSKAINYGVTLEE